MKPLLLLLLAGAAFASPILVGPIELTGFGTIANLIPTSNGATDLTLHVSGSNGIDTVSISTTRNIQLWPQYYMGVPTVGQALALSLPLPYSCGAYIFGNNNPLFDICHTTINGVTGSGEFSLGLNGGWVRVYDSFDTSTRALLAQAEISNTHAIVTDVALIGTAGRFTANFSVGPTTHTPEPGTWIAGAMICLFATIRFFVRAPKSSGRMIIPTDGTPKVGEIRVYKYDCLTAGEVNPPQAVRVKRIATKEEYLAYCESLWPGRIAALEAIHGPVNADGFYEPEFIYPRTLEGKQVDEFVRRLVPRRAE